MTSITLITNNISQSQTIFEQHKRQLLNFLTPIQPTVTIDHVGSTALPGSIGKGVIDIVITVPSEEAQEEVAQALLSHDYYQGELGKERDGRLFFRSTPQPTQAGDVHLHLVLENSYHHLDAVRFRDYMLAHPDEIQKYNQEKIRLTTEVSERKEYTAQKAPYIQTILSQA